MPPFMPPALQIPQTGYAQQPSHPQVSSIPAPPNPYAPQPATVVHAPSLAPQVGQPQQPVPYQPGAQPQQLVPYQQVGQPHGAPPQLAAAPVVAAPALLPASFALSTSSLAPDGFLGGIDIPGMSSAPPQYMGAAVTAPAAQIALALAVLGVLFPAAGVVAFFLGRKAKRNIAESGGRLGGSKLATVASVIGLASVAVWLGLVVLYVTKLS
jgi:hypothetical protein